MNLRERAIILTIQSKLAEDKRTGGQTIDVFASDGDIYLVGTVDSELQRLVAAELVRGLPGVRQVVDNLRIRHTRIASA